MARSISRNALPQRRGMWLQVIVDPPVKTVASIAAVHGCGSVFIQRSRSKRVAGDRALGVNRAPPSFTQ